MEAELAEAGADVLTEALRADIAEQLSEGKEVMYSAVSSDEGFVAGAVVTSGDEEEQEKGSSTEEKKPE